MKAPPARIDDVARLAGVSMITVSRTLRRPDLVKPETRDRVQRAVEALGYIPNSSASALASRRSGIVGVLVPTIGNSIFAETVRGVSDSLAGRNMQILLGDYGYSAERERSLLRALAGRQLEALIVVGLVREASDRALLASLAVPVVETWDLTRKPVDQAVGFSNRGAGSLAARHFLGTGRRNLAFGGGNDPRATARARGFTESARRGGASEVAVTRDVGTTVGSGRELLGEILRQQPHTDAIFFANDVLAVGALLELRDRGLAVPGRVAVVGLGDLELGRAYRPQLSTISVNAYKIGAQAGDMALARIDGASRGPRVVDVGPELLIRETG
jgi:LacI family transcriptional regulator, gluconate utilization system Gnt-I transcriptional repressor